MPRATPKAMEVIRDPKVILRFLGMIEQRGECWVWTGYKDRKGYGQMKIDGRAYWAHRVAFAIFKGRIPGVMTIHHTCHNTSCVNPDHVVTATVQENSRERWSRADEQAA